MESKIPEEFFERAYILYHNGFGYQPPNGHHDPRWIICWCRQLTDSEIDQLKNLSKSQTVRSDMWVGDSCIDIAWNEYSKIADIFNSLLKIGVSFTCNNELNSYFSARVDKEFSVQLAEHKFITRMSNFLYRNPNFINENSIINPIFLDYWNWTSTYGRNFCNYLRERKHMELMDDLKSNRDKSNYYSWEVFKNCNFATLLTIRNKKRKLIDLTGENQEDEICIICFDRPADTMSLPCEHNVVCNQCTRKLKKTGKADVCIQCTNKITHIIEYNSQRNGPDHTDLS